MGKDKFELIVNEKLGSYESPIDADALWESINGSGAGISATTGQTVSTFAAGWSLLKWFGFSIVVVSAIGAGYWFGVSQTNSNQVDLSGIQQSSHSGVQTVASESIDLSIAESQASSVESGTLTGDPITIVEGSEVESSSKEVVYSDDQNGQTTHFTNSISEKTPINANAEGSFGRKSTKPISQANTPSKDPSSVDEVISMDVQTEDFDQGYSSNTKTKAGNDRTNPGESPFGRKSENTSSPTGRADNTANVTSSSGNTSTAVAIDREEQAVVSESSSRVGDVAGLDMSERESTPMTHELLPTGINALDVDASYVGDINLPKKVICPSFGGKSNRGFFIPELQVIPFYANPLYRSNSLEGEEWFTRKKATESYLEAFQVNLIGRYQFNSGLYLQGGIGYGQIDEKFMLFSEDIQVTTGEFPVIIILRPNGVSDTIPQTVEIETITTLQAETYNYHRMIELPFAIGYEYGWGSRMGIYVDLGGSVNLSTWRKGHMVIDDVDYVSFDDETRPIYKATTGFKVQGSMGIRYYLSNGVHLSAGPDIRYHTGNWIRDEHPFEQRYIDIGLRLGAGVRF